jgi:hypothetical protein
MARSYDVHTPMTYNNEAFPIKNNAFHTQRTLSQLKGKD